MAEPASNSSLEPAAPPPYKSALGFSSIPAIFISLVLLLAVVAVFYPVSHAQFVSYDDPDYITDNAPVKGGLTGGDVAWAFQTRHAGNWHPVTWLSHMLDVQLYGLTPAGHHVTSVLFHAVNSALLFLALRRLTGTLWRSAFVAALFALHPLHVELVAWVSERKDVLSAFFFMLTLLAYAEYAGRIKSTARSGCYVLALIFFALGLMSKPMLVTVPFVLLLIDFWPLGRLRRGSILISFVEKIPFFALSAASCLVTLIVQKDAEQPLSLLPVSARVGNSLVSGVRYLGKTFWPFNLATPYPHPGRWPAGEVVLAGLLLCALMVAAVMMRRRFPFVLMGWLWFLGMLVPVIGLIQVGEQAMADRYTYLPLIGLFIALVWAGGEVCLRLHVPAAAAAFVGCLVLALCGIRARDQVRYWQGSENLYSHAIAVTRKNFIAYYNLGSYLDAKGRVDEAMTNYLKAVEIQPHYQDPLNNIGVVYANRKEFALSIPWFEAAVRSKPDFTGAHGNLANSLRELGRFGEAVPHYQAVLEKKPEDTAALNGLGNALAAQGRFAEAVPYYEASLRSKPRQGAAHYDLANALFQLRRVDDAIPQYRLALEEKPDNFLALHDLGVALAVKGNVDEALVNLRQAVRAQPQNAAFAVSLGKVLGSRGKFDEALPPFTEAVRLAPNNPDTHSGLGSTLAALGRIDEAVEQFQISIRLRPGNPITHFNLGKALAAQGKTEAARGEFKEALRLRPDFAPAGAELDRLGAGKTE